MLEKLKSEYLHYLENNPFTGNPPLLYDSMNYLMQLGGKRIRPVLTLLGCSVSGGNYTKAMSAAHAMEIFHNFTLVHDDIMDEAPARRGKPTVHVKYDIPTAILSGDNMLIHAYQILNTCSPETGQKLIELLSKTASQICEGQQMDMDFEQKQLISEAGYMEMIKLKTAVLLGTCLKSGAILAGADEKDQQILYDFGVLSGIGFQIMDDWLDAFGKPESTGKQSGGDILAGKKTIIYIKTLDLLPKSDLQSFISLYNSNDTDKVQKVLKILNELNIPSVIKKMMNEIFLSAEKKLSGFSKGIDICEPLIQLNNFLKDRKN